jgi:hypothetical protein
MSAFLSPLTLVAATDQDDGQWVLTEPLLYSSDIAKCVIIVPKGFQTDFASTPRLPVIYLLTGNVAAKAAVIHDFAYSDGQFTRSMADAIFREASEVIGVSWFRRWAMWVGVRIGGASHYNEG